MISQTPDLNPSLFRSPQVVQEALVSVDLKSNVKILQ